MIRVQRRPGARLLAAAVRAVQVGCAALVLLAVVDGGSVAVARLVVADAVKEAGFEAVQSVSAQPVNVQAVQRAYQAAQRVADANGARIRDDATFVLHGDRSVTLTMDRTAPTLVLGRVPQVARYAKVSATWRQSPAQY